MDPVAQIERVDRRLYDAVGKVETPWLDVGMKGLSRATDYSMLWAATAVGLTLFGGRKGFRAGARGVAAIGSTGVMTHVFAKRLMVRNRPDRDWHGIPVSRHIPMPHTTSFPSGHTTAAFAFALGVGHFKPRLRRPLVLAATLVGYSRVYTGVHYPSDVVVGGLIGAGGATLTNAVLDRVTGGPAPDPSPLSA